MCGIGVTSLIEVTSIPAPWIARIAASRPEPGPRTKTSTCRTPCSIPLRAASSPARCAAKAVDFLEPRKPTVPELPHAIGLPCGSVMVIIVLLNVDCMYARPTGTDLRCLRRVLGLLAISYCVLSDLLTKVSGDVPTSCLQSCRGLPRPRAFRAWCDRWSWSSARARADHACDVVHDTSRCRSTGVCSY